MSKYDALGHHLRKQAADEVPMTFVEIERLTGAKLPRSAYEHRPWWSNNGSNSVMTKVWLNAGFRSARVDMAGRKLVFEKVRSKPGFAEDTKAFDSARPQGSQDQVQKTGPHPMIGALKGTFKIEHGYDLTQPAMPEWADLIDKKYGPEKSR